MDDLKCPKCGEVIRYQQFCDAKSDTADDDFFVYCSNCDTLTLRIFKRQQRGNG